MNRNEKLDLLKGMLAKLSQENSGGLEKLGGDALDELELPDDAATAAARQGAAKLNQERLDQVDDEELDGLEAIVMPKFRPVVFIKGGVFDDIESPWTHLNQPAARAVLHKTFPSIGRIEIVDTPWTYGGTGFVVGEGLVMTNRHVAQIFAQGLGSRKIAFVPGAAAVDFNREVTTPAGDRSAYLTVQKVLMIHPYWDMALLRVDGLAPRHPTLTLSTTDPGEMIDRDVVVVGYPARDDRSDLELQDRIFQKKYNVKRLQPGKLRERSSVRSFSNDVLALIHDASTLGGNSGSAVIDATTGEVLALHFGGRYLKANFGVPAYELARDTRVVDAGVHFKAKVATTTEWSAHWTRADSPDAPSSASEASPPAPAPPPAAPALPAAPAASPTPVCVSDGAVMTFTIPLEITISLSAPATTSDPRDRSR